MNTSLNYDEDSFPLIQLDEQIELCKAIDNFLINKLHIPENQTFISGPRRQGGASHFQIKSSNYENDFYFRFGKYNDLDPSEKCIVISRIRFEKERQGYGTELIKFLCTVGEKYGYQSLIFECPNLNCLAFMEKLGFNKGNRLALKELKLSLHNYYEQKNNRDKIRN
ncbi:GNAT family N-acetyltransferase [Acinetobacter baumannii]|uniref:GNAT family N-acetyltransferase n=1 Tax=Acinetobacter baumannii TaxID=470 RepID=UPI0033902E78